MSDNTDREDEASSGTLHRERQTRGGPAARARADAQRALRARTAALDKLARRWSKIGDTKEAAARRRAEQIDKATERANARYHEALAAAERAEEEIIREALSLEGCTTKDIANWLAVPTRRVNVWRHKLDDEAMAKQPE